MITQPKMIESLYSSLLDEKRDQIEQRNQILHQADHGASCNRRKNRHQSRFYFLLHPLRDGGIGRARRIVILGQAVCFASPEDVIIHKVFAGRPRDMEDARTIVLKNQGMDIEYINKWLKEFDAASDRKSYLKTFEETWAK